jgi:NADPH-dependent FMN reductase
MTTPPSTPLRALALVCTLTPSPGRSSSRLIAERILPALAEHGVEGDTVRLVDHDIRPGAQLDMGDGDAWPSVRERIMAADMAIAAVVGNEDGAHKITADLFQALDDVGFTIPAGGATYWNGKAMHGTDYQDLDEMPEQVASTTATLAANAARLARLLRADGYPAA